MKVEARFNEQGLELVLHPEGEPEQRMIGAVLNQPFKDAAWRPCEVDSGLVNVVLHYEGHWSHKAIKALTLRVYRQESDTSPDIQQRHDRGG